MRRRDLLGGLSLVPLAAPAVAQCVVATFPRVNLVDRCEGDGVPPPSLALDFMAPGTLDPRITFTRASTGTYFDSAGVLQTAATNAPRWDYDPATLQLRGLLLEEARTNLLLNSATLGTQSVTVTAVAHTLSFYGTGTITRSGVSTGALVGTGATQRVSVTFTPTAGSLTCTVTGSVTSAQLEVGASASSHIPTTGASAPRAADSCTMSTSPWLTNPLALSYVIEATQSMQGSPVAWVQFDDGTVNNRSVLSSNAGALNLAYFENVATVTTVTLSSVGNVVAGVPFKGGVSSTSGQHIYARDGVSSTPNTNAASPPVVTTLRIGKGTNPTTGSFYVRRVSYWSLALSASELQTVTAP